MYFFALFRSYRLSQRSLLGLLTLLLLIGVLSGCGSSRTDQVSGPGGNPDQPAVVTGRLIVTVSVPAPVAARGVRLSTVPTSSLRIHVQSEKGEDVVPPQTLDLPARGASGTVTFDEVPASASVVVVEQLDSSGNVIVTQSTPVSIEAQTTNRVTVTLDGPVVTLVATPATATLPPNGTLDLEAGGGSGSGYAWSVSSNVSGGSVSASGAYKAGSVANSQDSVTVTDSLGNTATVIINVGPVISISPGAGSVGPRGTLRFQADGGSGSGFVWTFSTAASGGSVTDTGLYTAGANANTTDVLKVTDSLGNSATVVVNVGPLITIAPATATVNPSGTLTLRAAGGSGSGFIWALSTNSSGGRVTSAGLYTAGANGNTSDVVTVTDSLGNSATATLSVGPSIRLTPSAGNVTPKGTLTLSASGGSSTDFVYVLSNNASGGSISRAGLYTAGSIGSVTDVVTVTDSLGNSATTRISVSAGVTVTPASATVTPKDTLTLSASGGSGAGFVWTLSTD